MAAHEVVDWSLVAASKEGWRRAMETFNWIPSTIAPPPCMCEKGRSCEEEGLPVEYVEQGRGTWHETEVVTCAVDGTPGRLSSTMIHLGVTMIPKEGPYIVDEVGSNARGLSHRGVLSIKQPTWCVRGQGARLGKLSEMGRQGSMTLDTPMCMLYTRGGSAPFLGHDLLKRLDEYQETIEGYKEGMAKFAALDDKIVYTSSHDPAVEVPSGKNDKASIGVWGKGGKVRLDTDGFIKLQEAIQPDWFQCMSDADTDKMSTKKRAIKAVLQKSCVFGSLVGGFVIEGFHSGGAKTEEFDVEDVADLIKSTMKLLPENCPRVMHGVWRPDRVLEAVEMGVDIFDSSYPYVLTERSHALVFNFQYKPNPEALTEDRQNNEGFTIDLKEKRQTPPVI
ncbi:QTRT2-like protein [Mya arenaria]|uniref:QTRT2-like protein n=1 Tax=Mya arenaria TaxID=6604 RepID=A0ABY7G9K2_MYAAR|nr:QTRT2-like protein [Mya arenaria]